MRHDPDDLRGRQADDEAIRKSKQRSLDAIARIGALEDRGREAARVDRAARAEALLVQMQEERAEILASISSCDAPSRERWHARLGGIDLLQSNAEAELSDLCGTIDRERENWADTSSPALRTRRQEVAIQLGLIVSSLHVLISTRGLYESQTK